ncbi:hypothetical protein EXIGLDRAFT_845627 [Exidia glandulosa HHB12029]|uniref:Uncharacterized protein n=1 Tax=Exidia glandulosa HHB12029 TaxID=1314781 RepID=A0A165BCY6_EXIGL|nr:hypothetical protein EXIGLDRAFT_845627 [Exidia glandulosa HHB12029]
MSCTPTADAGLKLLTSPPVFDTLYPLCSPGELCRISKTCNGASQAVTNYLTHTISIDLSRLLSRFFGSQEEVLEFRRLQAQFQFLISGSAALQLLDRAVYAKSDLDLYLFPNDAEGVGRWLIERGYTFAPYRGEQKTFDEALESMPLPMAELTDAERYDRTQYGLPGVRDVLNFRKSVERRAMAVARTRPSGPLPSLDSDTDSSGLPSSDDDDATDENVEIQLIVADVTPYEAILKFHTTVVMNVVTWDRAIALFPLGTLEQRRAVVTHNSSWGFRRAVQKYVNRGFSILKPLARFNEDFERGAFKFGPRYYGDSHSWVVKLDTTGIEPPEMPASNRPRCLLPWRVTRGSWGGTKRTTASLCAPKLWSGACCTTGTVSEIHSSHISRRCSTRFTSRRTRAKRLSSSIQIRTYDLPGYPPTATCHTTGRMFKWSGCFCVISAMHTKRNSLRSGSGICDFGELERILLHNDAVNSRT